MEKLADSDTCRDHRQPAEIIDKVMAGGKAVIDRHTPSPPNRFPTHRCEDPGDGLGVQVPLLRATGSRPRRSYIDAAVSWGSSAVVQPSRAEENFHAPAVPEARPRSAEEKVPIPLLVLEIPRRHGWIRLKLWSERSPRDVSARQAALREDLLCGRHRRAAAYSFDCNCSALPASLAWPDMSPTRLRALATGSLSTKSFPTKTSSTPSMPYSALYSSKYLFK